MLAEEATSAHIVYPFESNADDETWLSAAAIRHDGVLADNVMWSLPMQRIARFKTVSAANAFIDELEGSGRWHAHAIE